MRREARKEKNKMTTKKMRDYLIDIIRTEGICDGKQHYFTEAEVSRMSSYGVKRLYNLCYPNFGKRRISTPPSDEWA